MSLRLSAQEIRKALTPIHPLDDEVAGRLAVWTETLDTWSRAQRLVGWRTADQLLHKGLCEVWTGRATVGELAFGSVVDIGSGSGLPGLLLATAWPDLSFHLVEARRKRVAFMREAARAMGLAQVRVHHGRSDTVRIRIAPLPDLLFVSRAFASPVDALVEAGAWNARFALVSSSVARVKEAIDWPPPGWRSSAANRSTSLHGNFAVDMARDHHEILVRGESGSS